MIEQITTEIKTQLSDLLLCNMIADTEDFLSMLLDLGEKIDQLVEEYDLPENTDSMKEDVGELTDVIISYYNILEAVSPLTEI